MKTPKRTRKTGTEAGRNKGGSLFWRLEQIELDPDAACWRQTRNLL